MIKDISKRKSEKMLEMRGFNVSRKPEILSKVSDGKKR